MTSLEEVARAVAGCVACPLAKTRLKTVPGDGPATADIMFIGEAPGYHENQQGRPFVGPAGQLLDELLASIGLKRNDVFIANVVKCFISPRVLIYTSEGYRPIKDIKVGDLVLTHAGRFRRVTYVRPKESLPKGSPVVRLAVSPPEGGKPVTLTVTPEHPFLVNGAWKDARDIQPGDHIATLGDRCEVCGRTYFVRYNRYDARTYHTCGYGCHNKRVMHGPETRQKIREILLRQYAEGLRDPVALTVRAHERTRELVAAGQAKIQHMSSEERHRGRVALAQNISKGMGHHPIGFGEVELKLILDRAGVKYVHHFALPGQAYTYDFLLPDERILIEVRGPGFTNSEVQARALVKSTQAEEAGYLLVSLWWQDIVANPENVKAMIERLLRNHRAEYIMVEAIVTQVEHRLTRRDFPLYNIGVEEDESYIAAGIVSHNCRPPSNRDPQPDEIAACSEYLDAQIAIIKPKVIVTLGRYSMAKFFPGESISKIHGAARQRGGVTCFAMYHPAAALHQPALRQTLFRDMAKLPEIVAKAKAADAPAEQQAPPEKPEQLSLF